MAEANKKLLYQYNKDTNGQVSNNSGQVCQPAEPVNNISTESIKNQPYEYVHNETADYDKPAVNEPTTT